MKKNAMNEVIVHTIESCKAIKIANTAIKSILMSAEEEMERTGKAFVVRDLPISLIEVDMDYQREPKPSEIMNILMNYKPTRVDIKLASIRKDENGNYHIYLIDGFHTIVVEKLKGKTSICCKVIINHTKKMESDLFGSQNEGKTNIRGKERYRSDLVAGKEIAVAIDTLTRKYGLTVKIDDANKTSTITRTRNINSIEELYRIVRRNGADGLEYVFKMIEEAGWSDNKMAYTQRVLGGIAGTYNICKDNEDKREILLTCLKRDGSEKACEDFITEAIHKGTGDHYSDKIKNYCIHVANSHTI